MREVKSPWLRPAAASGRYKRVALCALALCGLLAGGAALGFGPYVRHKATTAAARYGATVEIGSVRPFWKGVVLRDVQVKLDDVPSGSATLDEVSVTSGSPRIVHVHGGKISVNGDLADVEREVSALRERLRKGAGSTNGQAAGTEVDLQGVDVVLHAPSDSVDATVAGLAVVRGDGGFSVAAKTARVEWRGTVVNARGVRLDIAKTDREISFRKLSTEGLDADVTAPGSDDAAASGSSAPTVPAAHGVGRIVAWREKISSLAPWVDAKLPEGASVELGGVEAHIHKGADTINFGPGTLRLSRSDGRLAGEYESSASSDGKSLRVRAKVPQATEPLAVDVVGGPITLSTLGVRDGDMKLLDVASTSLSANVHIELADSAKTIRIDGDGTVDRLGFDAPSISLEPVRDMRLSFRGKTEFDLDGEHARVTGGEIEIGALQIHGDLDYQRLTLPTSAEPPKFKLHSSFQIPLTACQTLLDAAPKGLLPSIEGARMAGSIALEGHANFDTTNLDKDYDLDWVLANSCRVTAVPAGVDVKNFQHPFTRTVYTPDGQKAEIKTGPGSGSWASYSHISHFMETAVISFEDAGFERHDGFDHEAIKNSIRENLRAGKFVRGASTISMQLAKNLYLSRQKTISRKLEEAILTMYLEQTLTKEQIMELYLNVVELGPMIYGVEPAAAHYFRSTAGELSLSQAFYLASILPAPQVQHFGAGGAVSTNWMNRLRVVMKYANKRNRITDDELDQGLSEIVLFGSPAPIHDSTAKQTPHEGEPPGDSTGTDPASFSAP